MTCMMAQEGAKRVRPAPAPADPPPTRTSSSASKTHVCPFCSEAFCGQAQTHFMSSKCMEAQHKTLEHATASPATTSAPFRAPEPDVPARCQRPHGNAPPAGHDSGLRLPRNTRRRSVRLCSEELAAQAFSEPGVVNNRDLPSTPASSASTVVALKDPSPKASSPGGGLLGRGSRSFLKLFSFSSSFDALKA